MKGHVKALVAGCALVAGAAFAQSRPGSTYPSSQDTTPSPGITPGTSNDQMGTMGKGMHHDMQSGSMGQGQANSGQAGNVEPQKHLAEVDLYLKDAMNNSKVLWQTSQLQPGHLDSVIAKEGVANIDKDITSALTHISHVKSLPEAQISDTRSLSQLQSDLGKAKTLVGQLRGVVGGGDRSRISSLSSQLFGQLRSADDSFGRIAGEVNLTRVDRITVPEKQPVSGSSSDINDKSDLGTGSSHKVKSGSDFDRGAGGDIDRDKSMDSTTPRSGGGDLSKPSDY